MTLRDVFREFVIAKERREQDQDRAMALAWHVAAFSRQEKLPPLRRFLTVAHRPQTRREQRSVLENLSTQYGIPLRRVNLVRVEKAS